MIWYALAWLAVYGITTAAAESWRERHHRSQWAAAPAPVLALVFLALPVALPVVLVAYGVSAGREKRRLQDLQLTSEISRMDSASRAYAGAPPHLRTLLELAAEGWNVNGAWAKLDQHEAYPAADYVSLRGPSGFFLAVPFDKVPAPKAGEHPALRAIRRALEPMP
jgi:hypothetical protein